MLLFIESLRFMLFDFFGNFLGFFIHKKIFLLFVIFFPLLVVGFYLLILFFNRYLFSNYNSFFKSKELLVFFGFLYFFLFILLLQDFIFYTEMYRTNFIFSIEDLNTLANLYKK